MQNHPEYLPEILNVSVWTNDTYTKLYNIFYNDFIKNKVVFNGMHVLCDLKKEDGKERTFWHVTTKDHNGERLPDLRRCERLPWIKPILENPDDDNILCWENLEKKGRIKTYILLEKYNFIVILKKLKKRNYILLTAYYIEHNNYKRKLKKKYEANNKKTNA